MRKEIASLQFQPFMDALTVHDLPPAGDWAFEIKFDGYRCQAIKQGGTAHVFSRDGNVFDQKFPVIVEEIADLQGDDFVLDGEVVALDDHGRCDFNLLQHAKANQCRLHFYAFDLLAVDGKDLTGQPFSRRRAALERYFPGHGRFHISPTFDDPDALLAAVRQHGFEGVMAKRLSSSYETGERSGSWQKKKTQPSDDFLIGGYLPGNSGMSELVVGRREGRRLLYMASVKSGFVPRVKKQILAALHGSEVNDCPFLNLPENRGMHKFDADKMRKTVWVKPRTLAEVAFNNITSDGHLRHSKFVRMRDDCDRPLKS